MRQLRLTSLAAALLLGLAGAAHAGDAGYVGNPGNPGNKATPQAGGAVKNPPGAHSSTDNAVRNTIGDWAIGHTVYNRNGEVVGVVKQVRNDQVVVATSEYLGLGSRDIVLGTQQLNQSGSGADMRLITSLSNAELKTQPTLRQ